MLKQNQSNHEVETIIGPSVQVEGDFVAAGDIVVEGIVSGKIKTEKNLRIGHDAKIYANVQAGSALIAGEVQGNVKVRGALELTESAKVFGDVRADLLTIASGAIIHGKCQAGEDKKTKYEKIDDRSKTKVKDVVEDVVNKVK